MSDWELKPEQFELLEAALGDAFAKEDDLKKMLRLQFGERWDAIKKGETYEDRIFNLIEQLESTGKVENFVFAAANYKSNNSEIQKFVETHIAHLIEFDVDRLSAKRLVELLTILKRASQFDDLWKIGRMILPSKIEVDRKSDIQGFEKSDISNWYKCLVLLRFFLEDYPELENRPSIDVFVERLLEAPGLGKHHANLRSWLKKLNPHSLEVPTSSAQVEGGMLAYLMIILSPESRKVRVSAQLYCVASTGKTKRSPIHLDSTSKQQGILSTWKLVSQTVDQFIQKAINDELVKSLKILECNFHQLTIELFLPHEYLNEQMDHWQVKDSFGNSERLLTQHRLVLRSQERVVKPDLRNAFAQSWHQTRAILCQTPPPSLPQHIEHLSQFNDSRFMALREKLKEKIAVKITCPLPYPQKEKLQFLQAILGSGIPIAVWTRDFQISSEDLEQKFDQFLTLDLLQNPCELIENVRKYRVSAFDESENPQEQWGRHLTLLWDDFERMPVSDPFQGGQQLA